MLEIYCK